LPIFAFLGHFFLSIFTDFAHQQILLILPHCAAAQAQFAAVASLS
jgi:hypothetical protein